MRINKYLRECGVASRRKADTLVLEGSVFLNDEKVTDLSTQVSQGDKVSVCGNLVRPVLKKYYICLNKPKGYLTTLSDDFGRKTVMELVDLDVYLMPVGRLDCDTEGLLLLSNDGDFIQKIQSPKNNIVKTYIATVNSIVDKNVITALTKGVPIDGIVTRPCRAEIIKCSKGYTDIKISISEGKNRQVRKMLEHFSLKVVGLKRIAIGSLTLGNLPLGKWRHLNQAEIKRCLS